MGTVVRGTYVQGDTCHQGRRITGNLGTMFSRNLKVSGEILIVNLAHLSQKCDTPMMTQISRKLFSLTRKFLWKEKYCGYTKVKYSLQEEEQILLQEVQIVSQEKIITLSYSKNISLDKPN